MNDAAHAATPQQRAGMRNAILSQCFGTLAWLSFSNGIMLLYLSSRGLSSAKVLIYLALPSLIEVVFKLPCAYASDRFGKRLVGVSGAFLELTGFAIVACSSFFAGAIGEIYILIGIVIYAMGIAAFYSSWFALLIPIVPHGTRGRFFGALRTSWQSCAIVFTGVCALYLTPQSQSRDYLIVLFAMTIGTAVRIIFHRRIPELEKSDSHGDDFMAALAKTIRAKDLLAFCMYAFVFNLFTGGCPTLFGLIENRVLLLGDDMVVWLGNLLMVGAMVGFFFGGRFVDRWGTKSVFVICHLGAALVILIFLFRDAVPGGGLCAAVIANFLYGLVWAGSSIAVSTEIFALVPPQYKSLSTSICMIAFMGGRALSPAIGAIALKLGVLSDSWSLLGLPMTSYDSILLAFAGMLILLTGSLGLVPSVIQKAEWIPGSGR